MRLIIFPLASPMSLVQTLQILDLQSATTLFTNIMGANDLQQQLIYDFESIKVTTVHTMTLDTTPIQEKPDGFGIASGYIGIAATMVGIAPEFAFGKESRRRSTR